MKTVTETKAPACRIDEHAECPGPGELRREGAPAWEAPVEQLRCTCSCHHRFH